MKTILQLPFCLLLFCLGVFFSCDEELPDVSGRNYTYELKSTSGHGIHGLIKIRERNDESTQLELVLDGVDPDGTYPAYIHFSNALEGGGAAIALVPVDGQSGNSVTEISALDSGTPFTFEELKNFDGHLNIQLDNESGTVAAQADIGINALTGKFQQFTLEEGDIEGVSGILTIEERISGFSLITVELEGSIPERVHPTSLNFGSISDKSSLAGNLNPVNGDTGIGKTHLEHLDGELIAPYQALVDFKGFIRIHMGSGVEMNTVLAQGNIAYVEN